jgi:hypothetical protein
VKREQQIGKDGEQLARSVLNGLGLEFIEKIATPVLLIRSKYPGLFRVIFEQPVAGDHRAMFPDGRSVLIEVKTVLDRNLVWSDLREHQPAKLQQHAELNGLSLLVWVHDTGVYVMRFPIAGFGPGKGITPAQAAILHGVTTIYIEHCLALIEQNANEMEPA